MSDPRKPQAFVLDDKKKTRAIVFEPEAEANIVTVPPVTVAQPERRFRWGALLLSAVFGLVVMWASNAAVGLVESFFARSQTLGYLALGIAGIAGLSALAIILREIIGLFRLRRIEAIQSDSARAINFDDAKASQAAIGALKILYASRPDCAFGLKELASHDQDILDPRNRMELAARLVLSPLDEEAHRIIAKASRRVTLLTTVTPAAALDMLFVAAFNIRMLRQLASLYGGRPSALATWRLAKLVAAHLAVAGGLALSDSLLQHLVGKGLVGRLSARFGEGAVNGILTARIGLAARDVCRPVPQESSSKETLGSLLRELVSLKEQDSGQPQS